MAIYVPRFRYPAFATRNAGADPIDGISSTLLPVLIVDDLRTAPPGLLATTSVPLGGANVPATDMTTKLTSSGAKRVLRWIKPQKILPAGTGTDVMSLSFAEPMYVRGVQVDTLTGNSAAQVAPNVGISFFLAAPNAAELALTSTSDTDPNVIDYTRDQTVLATTRYNMTVGEGPSLGDFDPLASENEYYPDWNHQGTVGTGQYIDWFHFRTPGIPVLGCAIWSVIPGGTKPTLGFWANFESI